MLRVVDKENSDEDDDETEHTEHSDEEEDPKNDESKGINVLNDDRTKSNIGLFTPTISDKFDRDAKEYGRYLQKQSCRYWKRSFFYQGISSNSKKVGQEERNCLFLCLLIYTSSCYEYYSSMLDPEKGRKRKIGNKGELRKTKRKNFLLNYYQNPFIWKSS
jgi:hypothetical protein